MDKTRIQIIVVAVGAIFLVFNFMRNMGMFPSGAAVSVAPVAQAIDNRLVSAVESGPLGDTILNLRKQMLLISELETAGKDKDGIPSPYYTSSGLRDPFISYIPKPVTAVEDAQEARTVFPGGATQSIEPGIKPPNISVRGLLFGGENPVAVINDKVYSVGDVVSGATIRSISRAGVTIEYQGMISIVPVQQLQPGI